jgi:superfamily II DNA/RNA helicase
MKEPFPIQAIGVPELTKGGDIILSAETGTGKTFTYLLPILSQFMEEESQPYVSALVRVMCVFCLILTVDGR